MSRRHESEGEQPVEGAEMGAGQQAEKQKPHISMSSEQKAAIQHGAAELYRALEAVKADDWKAEVQEILKDLEQ